MEPEDLKYAVEEYLELWKAWGVDTLTPKGSLLEKKARAGIAALEASVSEPKRLTSLEEVRAWLGECRRCALCEGRTSLVFGEGAARAKLMFIGEGPGAEEDQQGMPFVGRAGKLLDKIIEAMGYERSQIYITNIVKCRPPNNRAPVPEEAAQCAPFLKAQINLIEPQLIVALGSTSSTFLLGNSGSISNARGRFHPLPWNPTILVMPTYHPAYLLRNPNAKRYVWEDMKMVKSKLENS